MLKKADEKAIEATVRVDTGKAIEQVNELISALETANSLADELAATLNNLKLDIKI